MLEKEKENNAGKIITLFKRMKKWFKRKRSGFREEAIISHVRFLKPAMKGKA